MCALYRQHVEIEVKLRPLEDLLNKSVTPPTGVIPTISLPTEYVYLTDEEMIYFRNTKIDYVITQLQLSEMVVPANTETHKYKLEFVNPVKELYMIVQNDDANLSDYMKDSSTGDIDQIKNIQLDFNGQNYIDPAVIDYLYLRCIEPMNKHTRVSNTAIYNYSFSLDPESYQPTGQINMSRIINKLLTVNYVPHTTDRKVKIYAKSYNVLRIENGMAGILFIDNNFI